MHMKKKCIMRGWKTDKGNLAQSQEDNFAKVLIVVVKLFILTLSRFLPAEWH